MDRTRLTERIGVGEADADPLRRRTGGRVVLAVDDVADPSDGESKRYSGRRGIGGISDRHAAPHRRQVPAEHATDGSTPDGDSAGPNEEDLQRVGEVVLPLVDEMNDTGPGE